MSGEDNWTFCQDVLSVQIELILLRGTTLTCAGSQRSRWHGHGVLSRAVEVVEGEFEGRVRRGVYISNRPVGDMFEREVVGERRLRRRYLDAKGEGRD